MYQRKVDVDMLNAVKSVLADVSSVSPSSEQNTSDMPLLLWQRANARNVSSIILHGLTDSRYLPYLIHCSEFRPISRENGQNTTIPELRTKMAAVVY